MFISNSSSVNIVRRSEIVNRADLSTSLGIIDRWVGLAHRIQTTVFHRFWGVLSLFKVYTLNY